MRSNIIEEHKYYMIMKQESTGYNILRREVE